MLRVIDGGGQPQSQEEIDAFIAHIAKTSIDLLMRNEVVPREHVIALVSFACMRLDSQELVNEADSLLALTSRLADVSTTED